jgi:hypothetical protein
MRTFVQKPEATQESTSAKPTKPGRAHFGQRREVNLTLPLQRTLGNHALQRPPGTNDQDIASTDATLSLGFAYDFSRIPIYNRAPVSMQKKSTGHTVNDKYEQEADRVAEQIMSRSNMQPHAPCTYGGGYPQRQVDQQGKNYEHLRATHIPTSEGGDGAVPSSVYGALRSPGKPLDASTRDFMEMRFTHDFSSVRVHTDARAAKSAQEVNARAYTVGGDIIFGAGQYSPRTGVGQRLLAHELTHVVQQRTGTAPIGAVQRAPNDEIEVTLVEVSRSESDLLFYDYDLKLPGSPPDVQFGSDGPIPVGDQKAVQLAFDLAYATAASPLFAARLGQFKKKMSNQGGADLPGLADLSQQKYLDALSRMRIHLADTTKNAEVKKYMQEESQSKEKLPVAGFTPVGGDDAYIRAFIIKEGREALASIILHESVHVAGLPTKPINEFLEVIMEGSIHGFEASVGLPLSQIVERAAVIREVKPHDQGVKFKISVTKPDNLPSDTIRIEIFDGNRRQVFSHEQPKAKFAKQFIWNGLDASGKPTESGIHSIRVVAGAVLIAAYDYVLRREKK